MADAQAIINHLATRIAQLETDKAVLAAELGETQAVLADCLEKGDSDE